MKDRLRRLEDMVEDYEGDDEREGSGTDRKDIVVKEYHEHNYNQGEGRKNRKKELQRQMEDLVNAFRKAGLDDGIRGGGRGGGWGNRERREWY